MRRFTRLALAALAAIGASGALVATPAASWTNFKDTTSEGTVEGVRQYTLSSGDYRITINGTPNADGSVTLGTSTAATNNTGIVLTAGAPIGTKQVSVMLDVGNLPTTTAELLAIKLAADGSEVELKRVVENSTSTIQQQWNNNNGDNGGWGRVSWTPGSRQILTVTYGGDSNPTGTATYLNGSPLIANVSGLMTTGSNIDRIGIGENVDQPATNLKVYGLYLFTTKLSAAQVASETVAVVNAYSVPLSFAFSRAGMSTSDNVMNVTYTTNGGTSTTTSFTATLGTNATRKTDGGGESNEGENPTPFFKSVTTGSSLLTTNDYPMIACKFVTNAASQRGDEGWSVYLPFTPSVTTKLSRVCPKLFVVTSDGAQQNAGNDKTLGYTVTLYVGSEVNETTAASAEMLGSATGTTDTLNQLIINAATANFGKEITLTAGTAYTMKLAVSASNTGGGTYSGIAGVDFSNVASRTVSGTEGNWDTAAEWDNSLVPTTATATTLNVSGTASLALDTSALLSSLTVNDTATEGSASLTFTGTGNLLSATTTLNANTDVSAITASLGAVTVAPGKKFTVGANTLVSSWGIGGSTLATKGNFTVSDGLWNMMKSSTVAERPTKLVVESGTLKLKDGSVSAFVIPIEVLATLDINGLCDSHPPLTLMNGAVLKNSGTTRDYNKAQLKDIVLVGDAKVSGNTFGSVAGSWASQSLTLGGHTLTVEMSENNTFYLASAGARLSAEDTSSEAGTVKVTSGTLSLYSDKNADSLKRANVVLAGGTLKVDGKGLLGSLTGTSGTLNLNDKDVSIGDLDGDDDFSGVLTGATRSVFRKVGSGTQTLSGDLSGFAGTYQVDDGTLELPVAGELTATVAGTGTLKKSGAGTLTLVGPLSGTVELVAGTLDLGTSRPAVTVTGAETKLVLLQGLDDVADDVTPSPISLRFADGIERCTVETKSLGGATKTLTISASDVTDGTVNVTFPTETGTVDDNLPPAHRTCGFEDRSLTGLVTGGMQNMTFAASPLPGQGKYGQIGNDGRPHSGNDNDNGFRTETGERGFTFSLKVYPNTRNNKGVLFSFGKRDNAVALLWQNDSTDSTKGRFVVYSVLSSRGASEPVVTSQLVTKAAWHAVSVVSSLETKRFYIIVDGEMAKSEVLSAGLSIENGVFQVGSVHGNAPSGWNNGDDAQVDDFRFDKVPLTQAQIARLLFHYAKVEDDSTLTGLKEFGSDTQVAWEALKATADARISVANGKTATATLTAPTAATLKVWGAGTLEVAEGESAQTIAAVELKEETTTLLLHRSQADVVTSRVGTVGTFKFSGGTTDAPLVVPYNVAFPGAIAVAADSCVKLECTTGDNNVSYQVSGDGQSSTVILTSDHHWGVLNTDGSVTSLFRDLTLSIGGNKDFWIRAGLTNNVWLDIPTGRTVTQERDAPGTTDGVLTVRNLTGGGTFTTAQGQENANKTLRLLNTDETASEYSSGVTINNSNNNKVVFAGKWAVPNAITTARYPARVEIGDGTTETDVQLRATGNALALTVAENATLDVATGAPGTIDDNTPKSFTNGTVITNNGTLKLTSGYAYLKVGGSGETVIPGSDFVFGVVDNNPQDTFANALTVNEGATFKVRAWGEDTFDITTLTLNGEMTREEGNSTVKATVSGPATLKTLGTNVNLTLNGTLTDSSNAFAIGNGSCLTLNLSEETTIANWFSGSGNLVIGDGVKAVTVALTGRNGDYSGTITVAEGSTLSNGDSSATVPFGKGLIENYGLLKLTGPAAEGSKDYAQLPPVSGTGDITFCSESATRIAGAITTTGTVTIEGKQNKSITNAVVELQAAVVVFGRNDADFTNTSASIEGPSIAIGAGATLARSDGASSVTIANDTTLSGTGFVLGTGTIGVPITFAEGSVLDATSDVVGIALAGKVTGTVKVKVAKAKGVLSTTGDVLERSQLAFADDTMNAGYRFVESLIGSGKSAKHAFKVMAKVDVSEISTVVNGNDDVLNTIYNAVAYDSNVTKVTSVTVQSTVGVAGKTEALTLFENLHAEATASAAADGTGTVTVYYDFGISQLHVKRAALNGEESAPLYVLLCAKVESVGVAPANYAAGTTVTLYRGTEVQSAVEPTDDQLTAMNLTRGAGEKWFAVPMSTLGTGTHAFKVTASKTTTTAN